jgi:hypothetical protein
VPRTLLSHDTVLEVLRATPDRLRALSAAATEAELASAPEEGEWPATEVLAHLRACADVWGAAIERILREEEPTIQAVNPRSWIDRTDYRQRPFKPSLRSFTRQRTKLLQVLDPLPTKGWARAATVLGAGRPLVTTVHAYADRMARHERAHWRQVERTLAAVLD